MAATPTRAPGGADDSLAALFERSGAASFGFTRVGFAALISEAEAFYLGAQPEPSARAALRRSLHIEDLVLARACAEGHEGAWATFVTRYQGKMRGIAHGLVRDRQEALELADSLYGELYGLRLDQGARISKFSRYMGGGSLEAWLRTVLRQRRIDDWRRRRWTVSWDETDAATLRAATTQIAPEPQPLAWLTSAVDIALGGLAAEDKLVLSLYFLDGRNLAEIGRLLGVHESTISRRVHRLQRTLRRAVARELMRRGLDRRAAEEAMRCDVRSLEMDLRGALAPADKVV